MAIEEAIRLNNQTVSLLERKLFNDATVSSCAAIEIFQQHHHHQHQQNADRQELYHEHCNHSIDQFMSHHNSASSSDDGMDEFRYEHGIALPRNTMDPNIIRPILVFNSALCLQMLADHCNNEEASHYNLQRAIRLYRIAYALQDHTRNPSFFRFVVVNNSGVIHKHLGNSEEARLFFEHLTSLAMVCIVDSARESKSLQSIAGFWRNAMDESMASPAA